MSDREDQPGPDADREEAEAEALTSETLWNIATGAEPCEDPALALRARKFAALFMRQQGTPYREIAAQLGVSLNTAWKYVSGELKKRIEEGADEVRKIHLDRLNAMLAGVMDRATEGDNFAINSALAIMGKIESLMGIEPPKRIDHTFGAAQTDEARADLIKALAAASTAGRDREGDSDAPGENG